MKIKALTLLLITLSYFGMASAAANSLITTSPISGSTVSIPPNSVVLTTQVALIADASDLIVTDPSGNRVDDGTITVDGATASIGLKPLVESGIYKTSYTLYSEGEAPLQGSFTFNFSATSIITPSQPTPTPTQSQQQTPASSSWGTNVFIITLLVIAFFVLVGLSLYARKLFRDR